MKYSVAEFRYRHVYRRLGTRTAYRESAGSRLPTVQAKKRAQLDLGS